MAETKGDSATTAPACPPRGWCRWASPSCGGSVVDGSDGGMFGVVGFDTAASMLNGDFLRA
jgi:hypothetical protein